MSETIERSSGDDESSIVPPNQLIADFLTPLSQSEIEQITASMYSLVPQLKQHASDAYGWPAARVDTIVDRLEERDINVIIEPSLTQIEQTIYTSGLGPQDMRLWHLWKDGIDVAVGTKTATIPQLSARAIASYFDYEEHYYPERVRLRIVRIIDTIAKNAS